MTRTDRAIGVLAGVVLGIAIVFVFVFFGSEGTIDAPPLDRASTTTSTAAHHKPQPKPKPPPGPKTVTARVPIAGGAPPTSGPAQVVAHQDDKVKLEVSSNETIGVELLGYGIAPTIEAGKPTTIAFRATKTGNFPLIASTSHIAVAQIRVAGPRD